MATLETFGKDLRDDDSFEYTQLQPFYEAIKSLKNDPSAEDVQRSMRKAPIFVKYQKQQELFHSKRKNALLNDIKTLMGLCSRPTDETLRSIIKEDKSTRWMVLFGERLGAYLTLSGVSTSQIRKAYGVVKNLDMTLSTLPADAEMDMYSYRQLLLLKPRLAYAAKKEGGGMNQLSEILGKAIYESVKSVGDFSRFSQFFEAILAYHKAYGGK